jgi:ribosomal protein L31
MNIKYKYAIGIHVMFYEIEMFENYIDGLLNLLSTVDNKENVYIDFSFNVSQFFEKIDTSKITKNQLIEKFNKQYNRIPSSYNKFYTIIDNDESFYTQTNYRREFNTKYCEIVDYLMWGETDSLFPKEAIIGLETLTPVIRSQGFYRFVACFADRKMWDNSWDVTVHPKFINHVYDDKDIDNINQAKSTMSIDQMNNINSEIKELDIQTINYPKIDGSCLVLTSDLIKSGVNIPPCFIHNDDESLSVMAKKILGDKYIQVIFKNILKVHARRHPNKRMYIVNENNPRGFCGKQKGDWWQIFKEMSQYNLNSLFNNTGKFYTYEDFKNRL